MKTKHKLLMLVLLIPAGLIVIALGLLIFDFLRPIPPIHPLPVNNGYVALATSGQLVAGKTADYAKMNEAQLRELVAANTEGLSLVRSGMSNECRVTTQFSQTYMNKHIEEDLPSFKRLAHAFLAEGALAEMENRHSDAARSYLDAMHFGNESARGGVLMDALVGIAIEKSGAMRLEKIVDRLDAKSSRKTAATLGTLDAQKQSLDEIMQQEQTWSRRTFTSLRDRVYRPMLAKMVEPADKHFTEKFNAQQSLTRRLLIDLAARAYELDKSHRPASLADLVPEYLKAIPQDPVTGTNMTYAP